MLRLDDCTFFGAALPEPFVKFELEGHLLSAKLLRKTTGDEGKALDAEWDIVRKKVRSLGDQGGPIRVTNHVLLPLVSNLGYASLEDAGQMQTREGQEDGGFLLKTADGSSVLRAWALETGADFDAPNKRGRAYRFSPTQIAERVLLAQGERLGLITDGTELRLLFCDPARTGGHLLIRLDRAGGWRGLRNVPDSYRLLLALASPAGVKKIPDLVEHARLTQTRVTVKLREQARRAVIGFVQGLLDDPHNARIVNNLTDTQVLAQKLWSEALIVVYRLLFVLKLESSPDPARAFSFRSTSLWRKTYSPNHALAPVVEKVLKDHADTGAMLGAGLRTLFKLFQDGLLSSEMRVAELGGMLFGKGTTPLLDDMTWGEIPVAKLLDALLWTPSTGKIERQRVHYGSLDVEDLGRVYEALLELEPGIAAEPMCRLRRQKLEVVLPLAQGEAYRTNVALDEGEGDDEEEADEDDEDDAPARGRKGAAAEGKTKVEWIEQIHPGSFYLRVGLGRKASGSYYTPHAFVRFLIQETLGPQVDERSPAAEPNPMGILGLKVLDPAMGSGHFLVEGCRYLGEKLYEACRLCDELAIEAEKQAERLDPSDQKKAKLAARAAQLRKRVEDLPDPNDELVAYLPSRVPEGEESGLSQAKAIALCRRLVAVHSLYGVDKNPLAVELAKLSLWLESYAEGLPLTFLDHRLICGDSLTGPFYEHLGKFPRSGNEVRDLFSLKLTERLRDTLGEALLHVRDLEASIGKDVADVEQKRAAKKRLDESLWPFKQLAAAWTGGVMLGDQGDDGAYQVLMTAVAEKKDPQAVIDSKPQLAKMVEVGQAGVAYDLVFPEVFYPSGQVGKKEGFHAVVGNPPWDTLQPLAKEFYASYDLRIIDAPTQLERARIEKRLTVDPAVQQAFEEYVRGFDAMKVLVARAYSHVNRQASGAASGAAADLWQCFAERGPGLLRPLGQFGMVLPSAFHANQSATGIRELFIHSLDVGKCFSFENRKKLFEIDSRFKFALVVAVKGKLATGSFDCAFYLHDLEWLFGGAEPLRYTREFVERTGGDYLALLELRTVQDADVARSCFVASQRFGDVRQRAGIVLGRELHMRDDAYRFSPSNRVLAGYDDPRDPIVVRALLEQGSLPLHEGKTFHQYTDRWGERPRYVVALAQISDKPGWLRAAQFFRLAFRDIARSTDERTGIFCIAPPGVVFGHTATVEREPWTRQAIHAIELLACVNSYSLDWVLRQKSAAHVSLFILDGCPVPPSAFEPPRSIFLAHAALRLTCNHAGYAPLWHEQVGDAWRESTPKHQWPVLDGDDARWALRAAIDAAVADAYGLSRDQYEHVLKSFSHKSYPRAPDLCLAAYDELKQLGLQAFCKKHDPYWDIPLNESLPKPVIDLPGAEGQLPAEGKNFKLEPPAPKKKGRKKS